MDTSNSLARLHAVVKGRVQGVSFRYFVMEQAVELDVNGWVRNRADGSVEVIAEASRPKLEQLLQVLRQGPSMARVDGVDIKWSEATGEFIGFRVRSNG